MLRPKQLAVLDEVSSLQTADRIDAICDAFHSQRCSGLRPELTPFLEQCESTEKPQLFVELLLLDCDLRRESGEDVDWAEYLARYSNYREQIEAVRFQDSTRISSPTETVTYEVAKRLGHFLLQEKVGAGATGTVWKARDELLQRTVAIKVSNCSQLSERNARRFLREAQTASRLNHPGIVTVHAVEKTNDAAYIVSELISGADLRRVLRTATPSYRQAAQWCKQLAEALHYAHNEGIVHRDIKPANIIIDQHGKAILTDFGLAKQVSSQSSLSIGGAPLGTPAYMSPEQAKGQAHRADRRSDIYSLGVVLFEMVAQRTPFQGSSDEVLRGVVTREPPRLRSLNRNIPQDLELICAKCLAKEPKDRYQDAAELADDLNRFLNQIPIKARRYRAATLVLRRLRPKIIIAAVLALGILTVGLASRLSSAPNAEVSRQLVEINTVPTGADIAVVPISETGETFSNRLVLAGKSPAEIKLLPGDYLVEAVLPNGQFQDVLRRVPKGGEIPSDIARHNFWKFQDGRILLPYIHIPAGLDIRKMTLVNNKTASKLLEASKNGNFGPFYIDTTEVTVKEYLAVMPNLPPYFTGGRQIGDDEPIPLKYEDAVEFAERSGKRLPTKAEWQCAQEVLPPRTSLSRAEWTSNSALIKTKDDLQTGQIACGGSEQLVHNLANLVESDFAPSKWVVLRPSQFYERVGVRCAVSVRPQFLQLHRNSNGSSEDEAAPTSSSALSD